MRPTFHKIRIFAGLSDEALNYLDSKVQERRFADGEILVEQGEMGNALFMLVEGRVTVRTRPPTRTGVEVMSGPEVLLGILGPNEYFGEMTVIEPVSRSATVAAIEPGVALTLTSLDLHRLYQRDAAQYGILILNIARDLCRRIRALDHIVAARAAYLTAD